MNMPKIDKLALPIGRSLLAAYFILPGIAKFAAWQTHIELMHHHNMSFAAPLLFLAGIGNFILGGLLLANRHVRLAAYGCVLYILLVNFNLHDFWNFSGLEGAHETQNFVKNLGILAGCLVLAGLTARQEQLD